MALLPNMKHTGKRQNIPPGLVGSIQPGDGFDPRLDRPDSKGDGKKVGIKASQLCAQVRRTLELAVPESLADSIYDASLHFSTSRRARDYNHRRSDWNRRSGERFFSDPSHYPIDEAPDAYKDFAEVLKSVELAGLATEVAKLKAKFVIKE